MHPFEAEQLAQEFIRDDRAAIAALAEVYKPDVPLAENPEYVARAKELTAEREAQIKGKGRAFAARTDRGWSPPNLKDVAAEEAAKEG